MYVLVPVVRSVEIETNHYQVSALPGNYKPNIGNLFDPIKQYIIDSRATLLSLTVPAPDNLPSLSVSLLFSVSS